MTQTDLVGHLVALEGLDQSGKQTQAERLLAAVRKSGRTAQFLSFPDYDTSIGGEIGRALRGERDYAPDVMQLLYVANRYEYRRNIEQWLSEGAVVVCDRYLASSIAYGEAQGLDRGVARIHPAVSAAAGVDRAAGHPASRIAGAKAARSRSLRA